MTTNIVGISALYHDSACALLQDGSLTAAVQEERLSRLKHDPSFPRRAFQYCVDQAGLTCADLDAVAYYEHPVRKLHRQVSLFSRQLTRSDLVRYWLSARQPAADIRAQLGYDGEVIFVEHHEAHAASGFYFSPFDEAAILTVDGVGEWATSSYGHGHGSTLRLKGGVKFPHSLGLFYSTITSYLGFKVNDGEYKVMGLAPYGKPRYLRQMSELIRAVPGGGFALNLDYFDFTRSDRMYSEAFVDLIGIPPRQRGEPVTSDHQDLARSAQLALEEIMLSEVRHLHDLVPVDNLCMAGGVALNCVANGRIRREGPFARIFVQPASGDAGGALGAAALAHVRIGGIEPIAALEHAYLGPEYSSAEVVAAWRGIVGTPRDYSRDDGALFADVAERIASGQVIGWCDGRMEFGPRALGARSILADPRDPGMRDRLNVVVKKREEFRPFAPAVLEQEAGAHFALDRPSPFMLDTAQTISAIALPAVTHVDGSARVQTVDDRTAPRFARLLQAFKARTGCPVLLNTSFNLADEPIVCSPVDALISFSRSRLDALVFGDVLIDRRDLPASFIEECQVLDPPRPTGMGDAIYTFA